MAQHSLLLASWTPCREAQQEELSALGATKEDLRWALQLVSEQPDSVGSAWAGQAMCRTAVVHAWWVPLTRSGAVDVAMAWFEAAGWM
jgi:hypothetical protein